MVAGAAFESAAFGYEPKKLPHTLPCYKKNESVGEEDCVPTSLTDIVDQAILPTPFILHHHQERVCHILSESQEKDWFSIQLRARNRSSCIIPTTPQSQSDLPACVLLLDLLGDGGAHSLSLCP